MKGRQALHQLNAVLSPVHSILMDSKESRLHRHVGSGADVRGWGRWFQPHDALMTQNSKSMCGKSRPFSQCLLGLRVQQSYLGSSLHLARSPRGKQKKQDPRASAVDSTKVAALISEDSPSSMQVLRHAPAGSV